MDVDEDEEGSQQVKRVADYGIEVDFSSLDEEELEVCLRQSFTQNILNSMFNRRALRRSQTLTPELRR